MSAIEGISWIEAERSVVAREQAAMAQLAPSLQWQADDPAGGWVGIVPRWPFARPEPAGLVGYLGGRTLTVRVTYTQAFPMVEPKIWPLDPAPDPRYRTQHDWHVNGDGSLCLLQTASDWDPRCSASELVVKAAGWFLEYLLMEAGSITSMTTKGIASDGSLDGYFEGPPECSDNDGA